jgi:hypothetical protein
MSSRARRCEALIKNQLLYSELPAALLQKDCVVSRAPCAGCPNALKCRNQFLALADVIKTFRAMLCEPGTRRKRRLCYLLKHSCQDGRDGEKDINFTIAGKPVCKTFYREATGFRRQLFDECVIEVLGLSEGAVKRRVQRPIHLETKSKVLAILDLIFGELSVKQDPTRRNHKISCRCTWAEIYEHDFKKYAGGGFICDINKFNKIRRTYRKNYRKSPRMTKGKRIE